MTALELGPIFRCPLTTPFAFLDKDYEQKRFSSKKRYSVARSDGEIDCGLMKAVASQLVTDLTCRMVAAR